MASWGSPRRTYRDSSPISPLTPLSPSSLPQWLRPSRSRTGGAKGGRLKMLLLGMTCLALGWMFTSMFGPSEELVGAEQHLPFEAASAGVLSEPSGFGMRMAEGKEREKRPGIITSDEGREEEEIAAGEDGQEEEEPSVSGALAELHNAVSHRLQSWNPYFAKGSKTTLSGKKNHTSTAEANKTKSTAVFTGETVKDGIDEDDRLGARVRIGKATVLFSGNGFWERCIRTHERHDKVHGYRLHVLRQQLVDDVWSKPAYILSLLLREMSKPESERLDWLFWVDADTVILNPNIPIETFLPPQGTEFEDVYLMYSNDWNGLNNGVFPVRVNRWAVNLFSGIVAYRLFKPDAELVFRDQSAMNILMQEPEFAKHIVQAPQRWFNAYQGEHDETLQPFQVRRGDLLVHFAGVPAREERMQYWLERAEQHLDDWEVPLKSTSYPQEARDFWEDERRRRRGKMDKVVEVRKKALEMMSLVEQRISDYGDRLSDEQRVQIGQAKDKLKQLFESPAGQEDVEGLERNMSEVEAAAKVLTDVTASSNRVLLQSAHEAIFGGEKDLLESTFTDEDGRDELEEVMSAVKILKALVMKPEEQWNKNDISMATNALTEARAKLKEKAEADAAEKKKLEEEAKMLEEAKLAAISDAVLFGDERANGTAAANDQTESGDVDMYSAGGRVYATKAKDNEPADDHDDADGEQVAVPSNVVVGVTITAPGPVEWVTAYVTAAQKAEAFPTDESGVSDD